MQSTLYSFLVQSYRLSLSLYPQKQTEVLSRQDNFIYSKSYFVNFVLKCKSFHSFGVLCTLSTLFRRKNVQNSCGNQKKEKFFYCCQDCQDLLACCQSELITHTTFTLLLIFAFQIYLQSNQYFDCCDVCVCLCTKQNENEVKCEMNWKIPLKNLFVFYLASLFVSEHRCALWSSQTYIHT